MVIVRRQILTSFPKCQIGFRKKILVKVTLPLVDGLIG